MTKPPPAPRDGFARRNKFVAKRDNLKRGYRRFVAFSLLVILIVLFGWAFVRFDRQILPLVLETAELEIQTEINYVINEVIHQILVVNNITASDFLIHNTGEGSQPVLSINTVLVNEISNVAAHAISTRLNNMESRTARVPVGMALGLDTLAQIGPHFSFTLSPIGNALVSHGTSFTAVGINQTHFSVWLTVDSVVRIINPVQSSEIVLSRHISLVDTIISGIVPDTYLNMDAPPRLSIGD